MKKILKTLLLFLIACPLALSSFTEFEMVIPTYNNEQWCIKNLEALVQQTYPHWHATIIVDCATDRTAELLTEYIINNNLQDQVTLIINTERCGALANIYYAAKACPPHKVICLYDGDDFLADDEVLAYYADLYDTHDIWVTYGQFQLWPSGVHGWCSPYSQYVIKNNLFRQVQDIPSHFRTFYAWLFHKIDKGDLLYHGDFYKMTWDMAIMFPLMEMAAERHYFVSRITYLYNESNPLNDHKVDKKLQQKLGKIIRSKPYYQRLDYKYVPNKGKQKMKRG